MIPLLGYLRYCFSMFNVSYDTLFCMLLVLTQLLWYCCYVQCCASTIAITVTIVRVLVPLCHSTASTAIDVDTIILLLLFYCFPITPLLQTAITTSNVTANVLLLLLRALLLLPLLLYNCYYTCYYIIYIYYCYYCILLLRYCFCYWYHYCAHFCY